MIVITEKAKIEIENVIKQQNLDKSNIYLRLSVVEGGCSGMVANLDLDSNKNPNDKIYDINDINVIIDQRSILYLDNIIVDFVEDLNRKGFKIDLPEAKSKCGCGKSFSI